MRASSVVALVIVAAALAAPALGAKKAFRWGTTQIGECLETCCCKVCSSPSIQAFPYGLIDESLGKNPLTPQVIGASCKVSTWADQGTVNDLGGNPVSPPDTLFWANAGVFGDAASRVAPMSCDCCRLSVDTNCDEQAPIARQPTHFAILDGGVATDGLSATINFEGGVALTALDIVEIRNNTHCGYTSPRWTLRSTPGDLIPNSLAEHNRWFVPKLPRAGCYKVCYYATNLTTPGWYEVGDLIVHPPIPAAMSFAVDPRDVLLEGNQVVITYSGQSLLNIFSDQAELRTAGVCGGGSPTTTTADGSNNGLEVLPGADWCHPPVTPGITNYRPLRYIAIRYQDCPPQNRLFVSELTWKMTLPAGGTYTMCYQLNGTWVTLGSTLTVTAQLTAAAALQTLYDNAGGNAWHRTDGWGGTDPCVFYGVRCDYPGNVVGIFLGRNNLVGSIPTDFFRGPYFNTLTDIKLDMNQLSGTIPTEVGVLRKLRVLDLAHNLISGTIPTTLLRTDLQMLYVSNNDITGTVPYDLAILSQQWTDYNTNLFNEAAPVVTDTCPVDATVCPDRGSTAPGVTQCGYASITEAECVIRGCCFNAQAPLTFGGTACFTRQSTTFLTHPPCQNGNAECNPTPLV